ncbi:N-acetylmuramoyl-L-alanine amidase [Flavobacterium frigoris]|uniref:N-acetylmuramoyl-L-alanine amidase n=1 Tax=Flavobacterium frigoris (strain PS1) TaxID=1086011 RepID=H7FLL0_FLAFP|nr:N-acetylmuramoyl-L-alanine amidase [Flavobacterium frigoris]EIA10552.1 N-acetylmuramoyl-L-alanine amidase [Flavobacterium frigoris PS1]
MENSVKLFLIVITLTCFAFISPEKSEPKLINVVIDAGHGGEDFGATQDEITEKEIVEQLITKIKIFNKNKNIVIHYTRSTDKFIPLKDRTDFINTIKPDLVLSLHVNTSLNSNTSGMEFYVSKESNFYQKSNLIAENFQISFLNSNYKVAEIKNANFYILNKSEVPAVIMELGYLTNESDKKNLANNHEQNQIAKKIIECISELR